MISISDSFAISQSLCPLQQHPHFAAALSGMGRPLQALALPGRGTAQVMMRPIWPTQRALRMVSRGPIWAGPQSTDVQWDAMRCLRDAGVYLVNNEMVHACVMRDAGYRQVMTPATVALRDLLGTQADRMAGMTAKWRNALRKAAHAGLTLSAEPYVAQKHKWILSADAKQQRNRRYRAMPGALTQAYAVMNKGQVVVVTAADGAEPIAAMVFLRHGGSATYQIGWTSAAGRQCNAHNLCLSVAMDSLAASGTHTLDLGQIDTAHLPGIARFKLGSGARPYKLGGTWLALPYLRRRRLD